MLRFACLVLDHDDTAVRSTPTIHYPSFSATLQQLRPGQSISLQRFAELCYDPGFAPPCSRVRGFTPYRPNRITVPGRIPPFPRWGPEW